MKKVIALLMVCGFALAFIACGGKAETTESTESTETATPAPDTTSAAADTVAADTTAN